jgi:hypothetical protein
MCIELLLAWRWIVWACVHWCIVLACGGEVVVCHCLVFPSTLNQHYLDSAPVAKVYSTDANQLKTKVAYTLAYDHNVLLKFPLTSHGIDGYAYTLATDAAALTTFENTVRQSGNNHGQVRAGRNSLEHRRASCAD